MSVYILRDSTYSSVCSRSDNFSTQWLKWYRFAKFAPSTMTKFSSDDIVIINLDDSDDPYGGRRMPECKKIFIVQKIHRSNIDYLKSADYVIYINDIQRRIAEDMYGINVPSFTCPRHPMPTFNTKVIKKNRLQVSGWMHPNKMSNLYGKLLELNRSMSRDYDFIIQMVGTEVSKYQKVWDSFNEWLVSTELNGTRRVEVDATNVMYEIMQFNVRIASHMLLWRNEPTIDEVMNKLDANDDTLLDNWVSGSSMLSIAQAADCKLIVDDSISFIAYHNNVPDYSYKEFSNDISIIINKINDI